MIFKYKTIFIMSVLFAVNFSSGEITALAKTTQKCVKVDKMEIAHLFDRWNRSLQTDNPSKVAENYVSDAVLLPTLSNRPRLTNRERQDYFKDFLKKKPYGKVDSRTIRLGCNKAIDTGTYTFSFKDGSKVSARYTYTYAWNGAQWLITTHHSSAAPAE